MIHTRDEVLQRTVDEYKQLDRLIARLSDEQWNYLVPRPESKDAWTIKDTVAHITYWKADNLRAMQKLSRPPEQQNLNTGKKNHLAYMTWRDRTPQEVLEWHRQVQKEVVKELKGKPEEWFERKDRNEQWPFDLDGHSEFHRVHDIKQALVDKRTK